MEKKSLSKEELIEQLKALARQEIDMPMHMGAMCYSPAMPTPKTVKCESCGKEIEEFGWRQTNGDLIKKKVNEIKRLGYDAKVEALCSECAAKLGLTDEDGEPLREYCLHHVFYFKTKEQEEYHLAVSNNEDDYNAVIAFLKNEPTYTDYYDATHPIKDELDLIKRMTGISID